MCCAEEAEAGVDERSTDNVCGHRQITVDVHAKVTNTLGRLWVGAGQTDRQTDLVVDELLTTTSSSQPGGIQAEAVTCHPHLNLVSAFYYAGHELR